MVGGDVVVAVYSMTLQNFAEKMSNSAELMLQVLLIFSQAMEKMVKVILKKQQIIV